jgi:hypothetical protein
MIFLFVVLSSGMTGTLYHTLLLLVEMGSQELFCLGWL